MNKITVQNISKLCISKLYEKMPDANASNRLQKELDYISKNKAYAEVFTVASKLVSYSRELGYYTGFHGCIGSSLLAFLLGITEIDPLKYNLPIEVLMGIHKNKPLDIEMMFDAQFIPMAKRYVQKNYPNIAIIDRGNLPYWLVFQGDATNQNTDKFDQKNVIKLSFWGNPYYTALKELSDTTGVDIFGIPFDDKQTIEVLKTADIGYADGEWGFKRRDITQIVKPKTFEDFVQISGWVHGTYRCAPKDIPNVPAFRDDVFSDLLRSGIDSVTAYEIMKCVQKGKVRTDEYISVLSNAGIPNQYIDNLKQVRYLFPKAHCIALTMTEYRIALFKAHYPGEFQKVMEIVQN